jgi:hypothetical protein
MMGKVLRRKGIVFGFFSSALLGVAACGSAPNPDETIRRAYNWYVETVKSAQDPWQRARIDLKSLTTERFLSSMENARPDLDGSGLIGGRNFDARLVVEDVSIKGGAATARVAVMGRMIGRQRLSVYLVKDDRTWKIDDVKLIERE